MDLPAPVDAASATIVMPTVSLSWTMSAASAAKTARIAAAVTTAETTAAAGHVFPRPRGAMARCGRRNREARAQERAREETGSKGGRRRTRSLCTCNGRGWLLKKACAAYLSVRVCLQPKGRKSEVATARVHATGVEEGRDGTVQARASAI